MKIDSLVLGIYQTNCYILHNGEANENCLIIDTGLEADELVCFLRQHKLNPVIIILTHGHIDHIRGIIALREHYPSVKVYIHKLDSKMLKDAKSNLSALSDEPFSTNPADLILEEGNMIEQAGMKLQVLHTPGHTKGGISLYSKNEAVVFVGDTLFSNSIGRTDFPDGSMTQLVRSIKEKLFILPNETVVYPGHGPATTIGYEKENNPFLR